MNPDMIDTASMIRPDGDVDIPQVYIFCIISKYYIYTYCISGECPEI